MKSITIIVAMTQMSVIGKENDLPWRISEDLKLFKRLTKKNIVIMGRKTYESIGKPLPRRTNIVISRQPRNYEGTICVQSMEEAILKAQAYDGDIFIIGGATIYNIALPKADKLSISWIKQNYEGDTIFPDFSFENWEEISSTEYEDFTHKIYQRHP